MTTRFLDKQELVTLTGRCLKSQQIVELRKQGVPFRVTATGHPVVTWAAVEGFKETPAPVKAAWTPRVLKAS